MLDESGKPMLFKQLPTGTIFVVDHRSRGPVLLLKLAKEVAIAGIARSWNCVVLGRGRGSLANLNDDAEVVVVPVD